MKIFIPSYGRAGTIKTHLLLEGLEWYVVVHDSSEFFSYSKRIPANRLITSNVEYGIARQRNWILDHLVEEGQWFCFMDDNFKEIWRVHPAFYNQESIPTHLFNHAYWDRRYKIPTRPEVLLAILEESKQKAVDVGSRYVGCATTDNPFFRAKKWRFDGYCTTEMSLIQKTSLRFDERFEAKDDMDFSAQNLAKFGIVLVNNFIYPHANHYDPGGIGNRTSRLSRKIIECKLLLEKWPAMCSPLKRNGNNIEEVLLKLKKGEPKNDTLRKTHEESRRVNC